MYINTREPGTTNIRFVTRAAPLISLTQYNTKCSTLRLIHNYYYDVGVASVTNIVSVTGKTIFSIIKFIPNVKFFNNLIGWMLANTGDVILK